MSNPFQMQDFKVEMITLVEEAIAANSTKEFIEFSSGAFRCRVRLDHLEQFLAKLRKLPSKGVRDKSHPTHKQSLNNIRHAQCAARLDKDSY